MAYVLRANTGGYVSGGDATPAFVRKDVGADYDEVYLSFEVLLPSTYLAALDASTSGGVVGPIGGWTDAADADGGGIYFDNQAYTGPDPTPQWWGYYQYYTTSYGFGEDSEATTDHVEADMWHTINLRLSSSGGDVQIDGDEYDGITSQQADPTVRYDVKAAHIKDISAAISPYGTPAGNLVMSVVADSGGTPTGSVLHTQTFTPATWVVGPYPYKHTVDWDIPMGDYWLVFTDDAAASESVFSNGWQMQGAGGVSGPFGPSTQSVALAMFGDPLTSTTMRYDGASWISPSLFPGTGIYLSDNIRQIKLGQPFPDYWDVAGDIYFRNVKWGTTGFGSSDLGADDFSSGDLSGWDYTTGDVEVVDDSTIPSPGSAPSNDDFANATALSGASGSDNATTDISGATTQTGEPAGAYKTVWYTWTAPADAQHQFTTTEDRTINVYTGSSVSALTPVTTSSVGLNSVKWETTAGTVYYIQVGVPKPWASGGSSVAHAVFVPAQYDDIGDAFVISGGGRVTFNNFNASMETNEDNYNEGEPSLWAMFDLSDFFKGRFTLSLDTISGAVTPYAVLYQVNDPSFDPDSPDFSLLDAVQRPNSFNNMYWGDGTQSVAADSIVIDPTDSATGKFYLFVGDWNFEGDTGRIQLTYRLETSGPKYCLDAVDVANTGSPTVTVHSGYIMDSQDTNTTDLAVGSTNEGNYLYGAISIFRDTVIIDGDNLPPPGQYEMYVTFLNESGPYMNIRRNGLPLLPLAYAYGLAGEGAAITGLPDRFGDNSGPTLVPILEGDTISISMWRDDTAQLSKICFVQRTTGGTTGEDISILANPIVLGASPSDDFTTTGNIVGADFDSGWVQSDMCIADNGDVYVAVGVEDPKIGGVFVNRNFVYVYRWDGATWTKILTVDQGKTFPNYPVAVSMDTDGTNVYLSYGAPDGTTFSGTENTAIYVQKYSPGSGWTVITTSAGIRAVPSRTDSFSYIGTEVEWHRLKVSPGGVPWIVWSETVDNHHAGYDRGGRPRVACYQGGTSWSVFDGPSPPDLTNAYVSGVMGADGAWGSEYVADHWHVDLTFCHHDGPNEYPSVCYVANIWYESVDDIGSLGNIIYAEWDGASWQNTLQFQADQVWPMGDVRGGFGTLGVGFWEWWSQGTVLVDDGQVPYLLLALGHTQYGDRGVAGKLAEDGSTFVSLNPDVDPYQAGAGYWSYQGAPYAFTPFDKWGDGWNYPSMDATIDKDGNLFMFFAYDWWGGNLLVQQAEIGTTDGWITACPELQGVALDYDTETPAVRTDADGNLYLLQQLIPWEPTQSLAVSVIKFERANYTPWLATHETPTILASVDIAHGKAS